VSKNHVTMIQTRRDVKLCDYIFTFLVEKLIWSRNSPIENRKWDAYRKKEKALKVGKVWIVSEETRRGEGTRDWINYKYTRGPWDPRNWSVGSKKKTKYFFE